MLNTLLHINEKNGLQVVVASMKGIANLLPQTFYSILEKEEFEQLKSEKRQLERAATLFVLHDFLGVKSALQHHTNGCPYLAGSNFHISISHTQREIAIALHPTQKVGIDVEDTRRNFSHVASRFLSETEKNYFPTPALQCLAWCAKEAVYKLAGEEGVDFAAQIALQPFKSDTEGFTSACFSGKKLNKNFLLSYQVRDSCAIAYALCQ